MVFDMAGEMFVIIILTMLQMKTKKKIEEKMLKEIKETKQNN